MHLESETLGDAFERRVVEREDIVSKVGEQLWAVLGMDRVHALQGSDPRGSLDLRDGVGSQSPGGRRVATHRLVVRRAEEVGAGVLEMDDRAHRILVDLIHGFRTPRNRARPGLGRRTWRRRHVVESERRTGHRGGTRRSPTRSPAAGLPRPRAAVSARARRGGRSRHRGRGRSVDARALRSMSPSRPGIPAMRTRSTPPSPAARTPGARSRP